MNRRLSLAAALAIALLCGPAAAQQITLEATRRTTPDDVDALTARLTRVAELQAKGALAADEAQRLKQALLQSCTSVVVTGEVEDAPLSEALEAIVRACQREGQGPSFVISPPDLAALAGARVSAVFAGVRASDALRALLRSQESNAALTIELAEEGEAFVITVHSEEPEKPMRKPGADEDADEDEDEAVEPPAGGAFLGVSSAPTTGTGEQGVRVQEVVAGSPAEAAGVRAGDVISAFGGRELTGWEQLRDAIGARRGGERVVLDVVREGQRLRIVVTLGRRGE